MSRRGRRTLLEGPQREQFFEAISMGMNLTAAALAVGLGPSTVREWLDRGRGRSVRPTAPVYEQFATDVMAALAVGQRKAFAAGWRKLENNAALAFIVAEQMGNRLARLSPDFAGDPLSASDAERLPGRSAAIEGDVILIDSRVLAKMNDEYLRAARGEADLSDDVRAARARLVTESPAVG